MNKAYIVVADNCNKGREFTINSRRNSGRCLFSNINKTILEKIIIKTFYVAQSFQILKSDRNGISLSQRIFMVSLKLNGNNIIKCGL